MAGAQTKHLVWRSRCAQLVWINMDQAPARANHGRRGSVSAAPSCLTKEEVLLVCVYCRGQTLARHPSAPRTATEDARYVWKPARCLRAHQKKP